MSLLLSVIVPVYNTEPWLPRCLDSLCGQTYRNLEIICVNDGSTDDSSAILDAYATMDSRIKVIHQKNAGLSAARNAGLKVANGEWITGVDSDDWLELDAYSRVMRLATEDVDMVFFGAQVNGEVPVDVLVQMAEYCRVKLEGVHELSARVCTEMNVFFWNKLYRRNLIQKYGLCFPDGLRYEDMPFFYSYVGVAGKVACEPYPAYHYWQRRDSIMAQTACKDFKGADHLRVVDSLYDFYERNGLMNKMRGLYEGVFAGYYDLSLQYTPEEMHPEVHRMAYALAVKSGAIQANRLPQIRRLKGLRMSPMERLFHWYADNRECFGVCGRSICSITYEPEQVVYRLFGKCVKTVRMAERA